MIICQNCYRPNEGDDKSCLHCGSEVFRETKPDYKYSMKQWEHFISSLKEGMGHDFSPHEFNEDGTINRGGGSSGATGATGVSLHKSGKELRRERRKDERKKDKRKNKK